MIYEGGGILMVRREDLIPGREWGGRETKRIISWDDVKRDFEWSNFFSIYYAYPEFAYVLHET